MAKIVVSDGQSLLDVALWLMGGTDAVFDLADANDLAITDTLTAGQVLEVPEGYTVNPALVAYYKRRGLRINTANYPAPATAPEPAGLIDWLESDFTEDDWY